MYSKPLFLLLPTYFHHWCHYINAHWTKTLSLCGICQCKAMQSHLLRMFKVVLFHFISVFFFFLNSFFFSVILILSRVQWTIKKRLCFYGNLKYACLNKTLAVVLNGIGGNNYLLIHQIRPQKEIGRRHVLDFHSNYDEGCSLSGRPVSVSVYVVNKRKQVFVLD